MTWCDFLNATEEQAEHQVIFLDSLINLMIHHFETYEFHYDEIEFECDERDYVREENKNV